MIRFGFLMVALIAIVGCHSPMSSVKTPDSGETSFEDNVDSAVLSPNSASGMSGRILKIEVQPVAADNPHAIFKISGQLKVDKDPEIGPRNVFLLVRFLDLKGKDLLCGDRDGRLRIDLAEDRLEFPFNVECRTQIAMAELKPMIVEFQAFKRNMVKGVEKSLSRGYALHSFLLEPRTQVDPKLGIEPNPLVCSEQTLSSGAWENLELTRRQAQGAAQNCHLELVCSCTQSIQKNLSMIESTCGFKGQTAVKPFYLLCETGSCSGLADLAFRSDEKTKAEFLSRESSTSPSFDPQCGNSIGNAAGSRRQSGDSGNINSRRAKPSQQMRR